MPIDELGSELIEKLLKGGYLQQMPEDPGSGPDSWRHYIFNKSNEPQLICSVHGATTMSVAAANLPPDRLALGGPVTASLLGLPDEATEVTLDELRLMAKAKRVKTRAVVALALRRLGDKSSLDLLRAMLADEDEYVRKQAAWSIGQIGSEKDHAVLLPLLIDKVERVRDFAAFALARLGNAEGARLSSKVLLDSTRLPIRRGEAALALADGHHKEYKFALTALRSTPDKELAVRIKSALDRI